MKNVHILKCEHPDCDIEHNGSFGSGRFCSQKCSSSYSTLKSKNIKKTVVCVECNKTFKIGKRSVIKNNKCDDCKSISKCITCGSIFKRQKNHNTKCTHEFCQHSGCVETMVKYLGFDPNTIGTMDYHGEFQRVLGIIKDDYYNKNLSTLEMDEKYGMESKYFWSLFYGLGLERRSKSDANKNALMTGRSTIPDSNKYNSGYHTSWNGTEIYYRSSYELKYAQELDEQKVEYLVEDLRIQYWDSQKNSQRTAIPDFYLPESNMIVEIKSDWTLDVQNMKDKKEAYLKHGYGFKLIVDFKEMNI